MLIKNYYHILGFEEIQNKTTLTDEQIKSAFHTLAKRVHPDREKEKEKSTLTFDQIKTAYDALRTETLRREYDKMLLDNRALREDNFDLILTDDNLVLKEESRTAIEAVEPSAARPAQLQSHENISVLFLNSALSPAAMIDLAASNPNFGLQLLMHPSLWGTLPESDFVVLILTLFAQVQEQEEQLSAFKNSLAVNDFLTNLNEYAFAFDQELINRNTALSNPFISTFADSFHKLTKNALFQLLPFNSTLVALFLEPPHSDDLSIAEINLVLKTLPAKESSAFFEKVKNQFPKKYKAVNSYNFLLAEEKITVSPVPNAAVIALQDLELSDLLQLFQDCRSKRKEALALFSFFGQTPVSNLIAEYVYKHFKPHELCLLLREQDLLFYFLRNNADKAQLDFVSACFSQYITTHTSYYNNQLIRNLIAQKIKLDLFSPSCQEQLLSLLFAEHYLLEELSKKDKHVFRFIECNSQNALFSQQWQTLLENGKLPLSLLCKINVKLSLALKNQEAQAVLDASLRFAHFTNSFAIKSTPKLMWDEYQSLISITGFYSDLLEVRAEPKVLVDLFLKYLDWHSTGQEKPVCSYEMKDSVKHAIVSQSNEGKLILKKLMGTIDNLFFLNLFAMNNSNPLLFQSNYPRYEIWGDLFFPALQFYPQKMISLLTYEVLITLQREINHPRYHAQTITKVLRHSKVKALINFYDKTEKLLLALIAEQEEQPDFSAFLAELSSPMADASFINHLLSIKTIPLPYQAIIIDHLLHSAVVSPIHSKSIKTMLNTLLNQNNDLSLAMPEEQYLYAAKSYVKNHADTIPGDKLATLCARFGDALQSALSPALQEKLKLTHHLRNILQASHNAQFKSVIINHDRAIEDILTPFKDLVLTPELENTPKSLALYQDLSAIPAQIRCDSVCSLMDGYPHANPTNLVLWLFQLPQSWPWVKQACGHFLAQNPDKIKQYSLLLKGTALDESAINEVEKKIWRQEMDLNALLRLLIDAESPEQQGLFLVCLGQEWIVDKVTSYASLHPLLSALTTDKEKEAVLALLPLATLLSPYEYEGFTQALLTHFTEEARPQLQQCYFANPKLSAYTEVSSLWDDCLIALPLLNEEQQQAMLSWMDQSYGLDKDDEQTKRNIACFDVITPSLQFQRLSCQMTLLHFNTVDSMIKCILPNHRFNIFLAALVAIIKDTDRDTFITGFIADRINEYVIDWKQIEEILNTKIPKQQQSALLNKIRPATWAKLIALALPADKLSVFLSNPAISPEKKHAVLGRKKIQNAMFLRNSLINLLDNPSISKELKSAFLSSVFPCWIKKASSRDIMALFYLLQNLPEPVMQLCNTLMKDKLYREKMKEDHGLFKLIFDAPLSFLSDVIQDYTLEELAAAPTAGGLSFVLWTTYYYWLEYAGSTNNMYVEPHHASLRLKQAGKHLYSELLTRFINELQQPTKEPEATAQRTLLLAFGERLHAGLLNNRAKFEAFEQAHIDYRRKKYQSVETEKTLKGLSALSPSIEKQRKILETALLNLKKRPETPGTQSKQLALVSAILGFDFLQYQLDEMRYCLKRKDPDYLFTQLNYAGFKAISQSTCKQMQRCLSDKEVREFSQPVRKTIGIIADLIFCLTTVGIFSVLIRRLLSPITQDANWENGCFFSLNNHTSQLLTSAQAKFTFFQNEMETIAAALPINTGLKA
ncbi:MAG: J domain-containing protein [Tatlockia sp.]|jgi:hypothetical protein